MLIICGMQVEAGEQILGASEETIRLWRSCSEGQSDEACSKR